MVHEYITNDWKHSLLVFKSTIRRASNAKKYGARREKRSAELSGCREVELSYHEMKKIRERHFEKRIGQVVIIYRIHLIVAKTNL